RLEAAGGGAGDDRRIDRDPDEQRRGFWAAGLGIYVLWNLFTALGAVLGDALGDPRRWGLDGAAVAAFLGLLWPRLAEREPVAVALACALVTALAMPFTPPGVPILVAALVAAALGWRGPVLPAALRRGGR